MTKKCIWKITETKHNPFGENSVRVSHVETFEQVMQQVRNVETDKRVTCFEFRCIWFTTS